MRRLLIILIIQLTGGKNIEICIPRLGKYSCVHYVVGVVIDAL